MLGPNTSPLVLVKALVGSYDFHELQRAAHHYDGGGLHRGVDWDSSLALIRNAKADEHYKFKATLEAICSACMWPAARVAECNPSASGICQRCTQGVPETSFHQFWECQANHGLGIPAIDDTDNLRYQAGIDESHPCLWMRGLLPLGLVAIPPEHEPSPKTRLVKEMLHEQSVEEVLGSGKYFGDGSGGIHNGCPRARRCGCAVVQIGQDGRPLVALRYNLPGDVQTVPRSEVFALILLLQNVQWDSNTVFYTDHQNLRNNFNKGRN